MERRFEGPLPGSQDSESSGIHFGSSKDYATFLLDPMGLVKTWNRGAQRIKGYSAEEIIGRHFSCFYVEEDQVAKKPDYELEVARNEGCYQEEGIRVRKDGSRFHASVTITALYDTSNALLGFAKVSWDISEYFQKEQALRDSQARLTGIIESALDAIITVDTEQRIILFNHAAEKMFQCTAADALLQPLEHFMPVRFRTSHKEFVRDFSGTDTATRSMATSRDIHGLRSNGEEFPIEASISQTVAGGQKIFTVIMRDVTDRVRAEMRFRKVIEHAPNGMVLVDGDGRIAMVNLQIEKLFGYGREELTGQSIELLVPGKFRDSHAAHRRNFAAAPTVRTMGAGRELFGLRRDGTEFPVEIGLNPLDFDSGGMVLGTIVDITERKQAESTLRRSQEQLAGVIGSAMDAIITVGEDQRIILFNAAAEKMFECRAADALGTSIERFLPDRFRASHHSHIETFGQTSVTKRSMGSLGAIFGLRAGGEEFPIEASISQIESDGQKLYTVILRDITARKAMEDEVRQLNEDLESRVGERTNQLQAVNKELEAFSYSVSHDLRAPLRGIDGFSLALLEDYSGQLDDVGKGYLQEVRSASQEMAQLIDDILQLARVTRDGMRMESVNLSDVAEDIVASVRRRDAKRKVHVVIQPDMVARGDRRLLGVLLTNLLENAWKFTSRRDAADISFGSMEKNGRTTYFVHDNGAGFDMTYADKLFRPFQRLHTGGEFDGTGIGLATVQRIVLRHGGAVSAEGEVNKGATIYFSLSDSREG